MIDSTGGHGIRNFILIWAGQLVSLSGSQLSSFALGVWVYQRSGSILQFALIALCIALPNVVFSPLAGVLVDRWGRRRVMLLSDCSAGIGTLILAVLFLTNWIAIWQIYVLVVVRAIGTTLQWPAYSTAITLLIPKRNFGRANGMVQLSEAIAQILAPTLGGGLLAIIQVQGIIVLDALTFVVALITLLLARIPEPKTNAGAGVRSDPQQRSISFGWNYVVRRPGLLSLLLFLAITNFLLGTVQVLLTPLVLTIASVQTLGFVLSTAGVGLLAGSLLMSVWGGPRRHVYGVLGFSMVQGLLLLLSVLPLSIPLIAGVAFLFLFSFPIIGGSNQAIWQHKIPLDIQGRVFAARRMIAWSTTPLAYLLAGPLADRVFEPLMAANGQLAGSVGRFMGSGPGRGISLLFVIMGCFVVLAVICGYLYPRLRLVEHELPDNLPDTAPADAEPITPRAARSSASI